MRDVLPGEMVVITEDGELVSKQVHAPKELSPCVFEYIYLSRPDSILNDISVYDFQLGLGTRLAKKIKETGWDIDLVCPCRTVPVLLPSRFRQRWACRIVRAW